MIIWADRQPEEAEVCNDYTNYVDYDDYLAAFSQTRIPVKWLDAIPNLQPRDDIWPTDRAPVIRRLEDGTNEFFEIRWGFPPAQPKRPPVINFRSEGRRFPVGRCLVPASWFYEFTGVDHRRRNGSSPRSESPGSALPAYGVQCPEGGAAFTLLTTDPSPDVAPIHDRQMVILERSDWSAWLEKIGNETDLLRALPAGSLNVEQIRP
jgi:putative SOS response-associated peptidase YedK